MKKRSAAKIDINAQLESVMKDAHTRNTLFLSVFDSEDGKLMVKYLETCMKPIACFGETDKTYYHLGRCDVIKYIKQSIKVALNPPTPKKGK